MPEQPLPTIGGRELPDSPADEMQCMASCSGISPIQMPAQQPHLLMCYVP